ncbi:hypothetical protein ACFWM0_00270 [Streptomyces sp. NPDC058405]|uniref:hypothetical protein n=1 Tax=unclassified Streptomyces TaxID=2593676 RepID=UPI003658AB74
MASHKKLYPLLPRAVRQLRRVRSLYAGGVALWALGLLLEAGKSPGSRQMWIALLIMGVFTVLLSVTFFRLWRHGAALRVRSGSGRTG